LQSLQIGETHSLAVSSSGKIYSWGWNDLNQLGVSQQNFVTNDSFNESNQNCQTQTPISVKNPRILVSGDNHTYLLDYDNNLYFWGSNEKYQTSIKSFPNKIEIPIVMNLFQGKKPIKNIISKGNQTVFLLDSGECFYLLESSGLLINPFANKIQINSISCSYHFILFLAKSGIIYSFGSNNSEGELGHGDKNIRTEPNPIKDLFHEKVVHIECGYKHVIAKTTSNKIYVWGWGKRGQLGLGNLKSELSPTLLNLVNYSNHGKIFQIQASYTSTLIMFENRRIFWWGTNGSLYEQKKPMEMALQEKVKIKCKA